MYILFYLPDGLGCLYTEMHGFSHLFWRLASRALQRPSAQHQLRAREPVTLRSSRMVSSFLQPGGKLNQREGCEFESSQEYEYLEYPFHSMTVLPGSSGLLGAAAFFKEDNNWIQRQQKQQWTGGRRDRQRHQDGSARRLSYKSSSTTHGNIRR